MKSLAIMAAACIACVLIGIGASEAQRHIPETLEPPQCVEYSGPLVGSTQSAQVCVFVRDGRTFVISNITTASGVGTAIVEQRSDR